MCQLHARLNNDDILYDDKTRRLLAQMHKAIAIIQFKLEGQLADKRPEWGMQNRKLLDKIDMQRGVLTLDGKDYELKDTLFPHCRPCQSIQADRRGVGTGKQTASLVYNQRTT